MDRDIHSPGAGAAADAQALIACRSRFTLQTIPWNVVQRARTLPCGLDKVNEERSLWSTTCNIPKLFRFQKDLLVIAEPIG